MRRVILYIAMSLDSYIADVNGGVGWLNGQNPEIETSDSYAEFVQDIDTVIMGWNTYRQVTEELLPDEWLYGDLQSYVITHREIADKERIYFVQNSPADLLRGLLKEPGRDIWICGGAGIVQQLMTENLIDRWHIAVIPTLLGAGLRLFANFRPKIDLKLLQTQTYNGIVELIYERRMTERVTCDV